MKQLILFSAEWCVPCQTFKPAFKELASEYPDVEFIVKDVAIAKPDVSKYKIRGIPTVILLEDEELVGRLNVPEDIESVKFLLR